MVRKLKPIKNVSLRRRGYIKINDELTFPVHTTGDTTLQNAKMDFIKNRKLPKLKPKIATKEQIEEMVMHGYNEKGRVTVKEWDKDSDEFNDFLVNSDRVEKYMDIAVNLDLLYPMTEEILLWEALGLDDEKDYIGVCDFLVDLDLDQRFVLAIKNSISSIRNSNCRTYEDFEEELTKQLEENKKEEV